MSNKSNELISFLLSHYPKEEQNDVIKTDKKIEKFTETTKQDKKEEVMFFTWIKKNLLIVLLFLLLCILFYKTHTKKM